MRPLNWVVIWLFQIKTSPNGMQGAAVNFANLRIIKWWTATEIEAFARSAEIKGLVMVTTS